MEEFYCSSVFVIILLFCSIQLTCGATHILLPGESLDSNQSLVSQNGEFKFGFFTLDSWYTDYSYVGIWFTYEDLDWNYVWIGNTQTPINLSQPYALNLSRNGNLILTQSHELIWSTNVENREQNSTILVLLDTGNLVLCDRTNLSDVIWQSFDHLTDTWLPGAWLTIGESSLVSRANYSDPSPGAYYLEMDGIWDFTVKDKYNNRSYPSNFPSWLPIQYNDGRITINSTESPSLYVTLNMEGAVNIWRGAELLYGLVSQCTLNCGPFGLCISKFGSGNYSCKCPFGFRPKSSEEFAVQNYSSGCIRNVSWNCNTYSVLDSENYMFHSLDNILQWPYDRQHLKALSNEKCQNACLKDCSCTGYAWRQGYCYPLYRELSGITISDDSQTGDSINIRLAISSNNTIKRTGNKNIKLIVSGVVVSVTVCLLILWIFKGKFLCVRVVNLDYYLSSYTYNDMKNSTRNFSSKLGEGGFGCVYKGRLFDHHVAVKKLKILGQEEKQFRTEVQTLGMIRHSNLVELLGFCAEGQRRLLVYEYMSNGSLDSHLFNGGSNILSWKNRYKISVGIARGLAYLHEQCRDCIIHCDIKPENVLLDEQFSAKIADFGMAKLLGRDFSRVLTTMRGTIGYMAPEWISGEAITQKADVYSFGMMLFEIISGKRNASTFDNSRYPYFPLYAIKTINEGEVLCLLDKKLRGNVNVVQLIHACKVAGWCIQDSEARRPSMGKVVLMLQGVIDVGIPPIPHSLLNLVDAENY